MLSTAWLTFLSTFLITQGYYFSYVLSSFSGTRLVQGMVEAHFNLQFTDIYFAIFIYVLFRHRKKFKFKISWSDLLLLPILLGAILSTWYSSFPDVAWFGFYVFFRNIIIFLATYVLASNKKNIRVMGEILVSFIVINALLVLLQKINGGIFGFPFETTHIQVANESRTLFRPFGMLSNTNLVASLLVMFLPLSLILIDKKKKMGKWFNYQILLSFLFVVAIIFTASRTNWILLLLLGGLFLLRFNGWRIIREKAKLIPRSILNVSLFGLLILIIPIVAIRIKTLDKIYVKGGAIDFRLFHIEQSIKLITDRPWGIGINTFQYETISLTDKRLIPSQTPAHNLLAESLVGLGLPGFIFWLCLISYYLLFAVRDLFTKKFGFQWAVAWGIFAYLFSSQVFTWFLDLPISAIFYMLLGIYKRIIDGKKVF